MKKVFQTIVDKDHGNCMQAAIASLFELELDDVPNFIEAGRNANYDLFRFLWSKNLEPTSIAKNRRNRTTEFLKEIAKFDGGINGYFYAIIPSQTFKDGYHAVVVDSELNIVHDPNPNQKGLKLTADDVESFITVKDMIIGKTGKLFSKKDWDNTTEEERDLNTYYVGE